MSYERNQEVQAMLATVYPDAYDPREEDDGSVVFVSFGSITYEGLRAIAEAFGTDLIDVGIYHGYYGEADTEITVRGITKWPVLG